LLHRMKGVRRTTVMLVAAGAALLVFATAGSAGSPKIQNGDFETGDATGWTTDCEPYTTSDCTGQGWFVSNKKLTPVNGQSWYGPMQKEWEAVSDFSSNPPSADNEYATAVLVQQVSLGSKKSKLSFDLEWNNRTGVWCNPGDLDPNSDCGAPPWNQQIRVFIQNAGDDPYTDPAVLTLFQSHNSTPFKQKKTKISMSLAGLSGPYQIVFAAVGAEYILNVGVDEVSINNG